MQLPRYKAYKDSGVEWLGQVPDTWSFEKGKWLFEKQSRHVRPQDDIVTAFRDGEVTLRKNRRTEGFTNAIQEHGYQGIRKGDLVIHAMDAFAGAIGVSDSDGKSTPVYSVCTPSGEFNTNPHYYAYLLRYMAFSGFILSLAKGIRERSTDFRFTDFSTLTLPLPPKEDQKQIVSFLDQKTGEIDEAIAKKKKLIELLQEQKSILINQAVTRGLNPDAPMKDSGVEWIGEIPAHWEVKRNRFLFVETNERSPKGEEIHLSMTQKYGLIPAAEVDIQTLQSESYEGAKLCQEGDLVLNRLKAHLAVFSVAPSDGVISPDYSVFKLRDTINFSKYFEHLFKTRGYLSEFNRRVRGIVVGFYRLYSVDFYDIPSPVPPSEEQHTLLEHIEQLEMDTKNIVEHIKREVITLQEFKTTLISSAVTGKIKV